MYMYFLCSNKINVSQTCLFSMLQLRFEHVHIHDLLQARIYHNNYSFIVDMINWYVPYNEANTFI